LRNITEHRKSEEAEVKARRIAEALQETSLAISSTLEFNRILNMILEQIGHVLVFDNASISLVQGDEFIIIAMRGFERVDGFVGSRWPLEGSPNQQVLQERRPVIIPDIEADYSLYYQLPRDTIRSVLMIPLFFKDLVVGFLNLGSQELDHFTAEDEHVAAAFAAQVAVALENSRLYEEAQRLATIDTLTGLYNRRHFFFLADREIERALRYNIQLAVIMIDLDQFKTINDTYGHIVGDQVLRAVANVYNQALRKVDIVGRYGGEEFTIILPEIGLEGAKYVAERLRTLIAAIDIKTKQGRVKVTISQGLAALDEEHNTLEILLERADRALYAAKATGGNQVATFD
jgi:diguanylate cyclase (GGDEF)-like protein